MNSLPSSPHAAPSLLRIQALEAWYELLAVLRQPAFALPTLLFPVVFYLLFAVGLVIFAVAPHTAPHSWATTLTMAALFGFFTYATYDLTNWATLKDWPWKLSLIDMAWGTVVSTASAAGGKAALGWATRA